MIELTYGNFKDPQFEAALYKMGSVVYEDDKVSDSVALLIRNFQRYSRKIQQVWDILKLEHAELEESGAVRIDTDSRGNKIFQIKPDKLAAWNVKLAEFDQTKVEFPGEKLKISDLRQAKLSPNELAFLDPILE